MGQSQSVRREEEDYLKRRTEWLKPIDTREQLLHRYRDTLGTTCLSFEEREWLEIVFEKFATKSGYWSESDLTSFLSLSFPEPSTQLIRDAGPTLYRLILRVGSYPYHQDPVEKLDFVILRTAIVILLRNDEHGLRLTDNDEEENELAARLQARCPRLVFQSLAPTLNLQTDEKGESDDEDVAESLRMISQRSVLRHPTNPKIGTPAPKLPSPSSLPSSHARMLEGHVSKADLKVLIRLFLACQLCWGGSGPEHVVASPSNGFNKATDSVLRAFNLDQEGRCGWQDFNRVMVMQQPGLQMAMPQILEPLIKKPRTISKEVFLSLHPAEATELLRSECRSAESRFPTPGAILNLPLLCQLMMFLPEDLPLDNAKLIFSTKGEQKMTQAIKAHIDSPSHASLILISGSSSRETASSPTGEHTVCGVYLPSDNSISLKEVARPIMFQCQPKHSIWPGKIDCERSSLQGGLITDDLDLRIDATLDAHAELHINSRLRDGSLTLPVDGKSDACESWHFSIANLEVFDVTLAAD